MMIATMSPLDLKNVPRERREVIDVRTPMEFAEVHLEGARNVPLDALDPKSVMDARALPGEPLYIVCRTGGRGKKACERFHAAGFTNVINIEGGTLACESAHLPLVRGRKMMSLERQVRIVAGSMVLVGVVLGLTVHVGFLGLSAFVGAGLVFAGITDTCGMGLLLVRMPWNRVRPTEQPAVPEAVCPIPPRKVG